MEKVKWGILSTAKIGRLKVIPAMQASKYCDIAAIASQSIQKAKATAEELKIPKAYGSYEDLLNDKEIEAVYIPLPNHLHVSYTIKALEAGKHVLCEKPISLTINEAEKLINEVKKYPNLKVMEAFMYKFHPQWQKVKELVNSGAIGKLRTVQSFFSYSNLDAENIRNKADIGGGGLMDIGCYCISFSRFLFNDEPANVVGSIDFDPVMKIDRLTSGILEFIDGTATFTCSTQLQPYQRVNVLGTSGRIEIEIPVNAPPDQHTRIFLDANGKKDTITFDACDQYTIQGDEFSKAILNNTVVPFPIEDAYNNMRVVEAIFNSKKNNAWHNI